MISRINIGAALFFIIMSLYCGHEKQNADEHVIISIADDKLTLENLEREIPFDRHKTMHRSQVMNYIQRWTENELIVQEAYRLGLNNAPALQDVLKKAEKEFLVNKLLDSLLTKDIEVTEQELINYYETNKDSFIRAKKEIRALHILVADQNKANALRRRILRGENFEDVARAESLDFARKGRIDMGYFSPNDVVPEIARRVFSWKKGSITRPIKSEFGYHIFKILDVRLPNTVREYDEVKDTIKNVLLHEKRKEVYKNFIVNLKSKIEIKTNYELLEQLASDTLENNSMMVADSI